MKTVVVELDTYSLKYENVLAVSRAFLERGINVQMWNSGVTSALDMVAEIKPDLVFYHSGISNRAKEIILAESPSVRLVETSIFENAVIADVLAFKKIDPHPLFEGGQVCVVQFPDIEDTEDIVLKSQMSVKNSDQFRLFSIKQVSGGKFCGWVPKELHPIIFSSAQSVLALSVHTAVNALLCNDNVVLAVDGVAKKFSMSPEEIDALSNVTIANSYIGA